DGLVQMVERLVELAGSDAVGVSEIPAGAFSLSYAAATSQGEAGEVAQTGEREATSPPFTSSQATSGLQHVQVHCGSCHGDNLMGGMQGGPPLAGSYFENRWGGRSLDELFNVMHTTMPLNAPSSLPTSTYLEILTYI